MEDWVEPWEPGGGIWILPQVQQRDRTVLRWAVTRGTLLKLTLAVAQQMSRRRTIYCGYLGGSGLVRAGGRQERENERDRLWMCFPRFNTTSGWLCDLMQCRMSREGLEYRIKSPV